MADFWTLLKAAPDIVKILFLVFQGIKAGVDFVEFKIDLRKFKDATEPAKHDKDTSQLEGIFHPKPDGNGDSARKP